MALSERGGQGERRVSSNPYEASRRQRVLLIRVVRITFAVLFSVVTGLALIGGLAGEEAPSFWPLTLTFAVIVGVTVIAVDLLTPSKKISTIVSVMVGLLASMLATAAVGFVIDLVVNTYDFPVESEMMDQITTIMKILIGVGMAYLFISTVLQTQDDFRLVIPYVEFAKQIRGSRPIVVDTSALIDARVVELGETGLIQSPIVVPRFVVEELQRLADAQDKTKRARGRRGLDVVSRLQRIGRLDVSVDETPVPGLAVDQMLVELGSRLGAIVMTTDTGLERVARIQGVPVINVNDVANAMKLSVIPGQTLRVEILRAGEQAGQGVGYLDDGTMVVAEDGGESIGRTVELTVTSSMQTSAGKLVFGRIESVAAANGAHAVEERVEDAAPARAKGPPAKPPGASPRNPRR